MKNWRIPLRPLLALAVGIRHVMQLERCGLLMAATAAFVPVHSLYADVDFTWNYLDNGDGTVTVFDSFDSDGVESIDIPDEIDGKAVVAIMNDCPIRQVWNLESVTIPASVKEIGYFAFAGYQGLKTVVFRGNREDIEIDPTAFLRTDYIRSLSPFKIIADTYEPNFVVGYQGWSKTISPDDWPDGVTDIIGDAFRYDENIVHVILPSGMKTIGDGAFCACSSLKEVVLNEGLETVGPDAFGFCAFNEIAIPSSVTTIGGLAFRCCRSLTSITIPGSVTNIGANAFYGCSKLKRVNLPRRFEGSLDESLFEGCPDDMKITYYDPSYTIRFHRNDASDEKTADYDFAHGVDMHLPSLAKLGWARRGCDFLGWATSRANADAGKVWKKDWAAVSTAAEVGETLDVYAVWALKPGYYAIEFVRNDGAGTWRTVGFNHGEKTRMPSLANGLGWARRGYDFKGWALTAADANAGKVWKGDWAYVSAPVKAGQVLTVYAVWELKPGYYQIRYNKNDGSGKWRTLGFQLDASTKLSTISALGWERPGYTFKGWGSNKANADAGKVWKPDGEWVTNATAEGRTLSIYAIWE